MVGLSRNRIPMPLTVRSSAVGLRRIRLRGAPIVGCGVRCTRSATSRLGIVTGVAGVPTRITAAGLQRGPCRQTPFLFGDTQMKGTPRHLLVPPLLTLNCGAVEPVRSTLGDILAGADRRQRHTSTASLSEPEELLTD